MKEKLCKAILYYSIIITIFSIGCYNVNRNEDVIVTYGNSYEEQGYISYTPSEKTEELLLISSRINGRYALSTSPEYCMSIDYSLVIGNGDGMTLCSEADFCLSGSVIRKDTNGLNIYVMSPLKGRLKVSKSNGIVVEPFSKNTLSDLPHMDQWVFLRFVGSGNFDENISQISTILAEVELRAEFNKIHSGNIRFAINDIPLVQISEMEAGTL